MTHLEAYNLARRAVACKWWRWMPGMQYKTRLGYSHRVDSADVIIDVDCTPDLSDPATLGCLLRLVREAWGDPGLSTVATWSPSTVHASDYLWSIRGGHSHGGTFRRLLTDRAWDTEAKALVAALEAAPC